MRADLAADAVLERRDDLAAGRVVLRVRGEDHADVDRQPHRVALDLDVPLLEDVEQAHLDAPGEVGQLVEREDPAVRARQQAVVHRELAREVEAPAGGADGVDVPDDVGDRHVRRRELLDVALPGLEPADRRLVAPLGDEVAAALAQRGERVVVDLAARDDGHLGVEECRESAEDAALRLPAQAEQDHVVAGQDGVRDLRDDGVFVAEDAGEERLAATGACASGCGASPPSPRPCPVDGKSGALRGYWDETFVGNLPVSIIGLVPPAGGPVRAAHRFTR